MESIEKSILNLLNDKKMRTSIEIINELGFGKKYDSVVIEILHKLVDNYDLYCSKKGKYMLFSDSEQSKKLVKGKFSDTANDYGFVECVGSEDIFIHGSNNCGAIDGDIVLVEIIKNKRDDKKSEGRIVKIIKHETKEKVGEVYHYDGRLMVSLDDKKIKKLIVLKGNEKDLSRLVDGDKVMVSFIANRKDKEYVSANFVKRIGHINDPDIDIVSIIADCGFDLEFSEEVEKQLKNIPTKVDESEIKNRRDLRDEVIFTIDGDDTKDIDDAIEVEKTSDGYKLGVHIADVSYYVKEGTALYDEAMERGTSVYLADRVIPMLPHKLSNGICSLNPGVERLAISCVMNIDKNGNIKDYEIFPSIIKSRIQMTYKKVNSILSNRSNIRKYKSFDYKTKGIKEEDDIKNIRSTTEDKTPKINNYIKENSHKEYSSPTTDTNYMASRTTADFYPSRTGHDIVIMNDDNDNDICLRNNKNNEINLKYNYNMPYKKRNYKQSSYRINNYYNIPRNKSENLTCEYYTPTIKSNSGLKLLIQKNINKKISNNFSGENEEESINITLGKSSDKSKEINNISDISNIEASSNYFGEDLSNEKDVKVIKLQLKNEENKLKELEKEKNKLLNEEKKRRKILMQKHIEHTKIKNKSLICKKITNLSFGS